MGDQFLKGPIEIKEWSDLKKSNSFRFRRFYSVKLKSNQMDKTHLKKKTVKKIHKGPLHLNAAANTILTINLSCELGSLKFG